MSTVMETFKQLKEDHPDMKIGKSKSASLRPPNVFLVSEKDHSVCCCAYHENFDMLVAGMQKVVPNFPDVDSLLAMCVCPEKEVKCYLGECDVCKGVSKLDIMDDTIALATTCSYVQWKRNEKVEISSNLAEAK